MTEKQEAINSQSSRRDENSNGRKTPITSNQQDPPSVFGGSIGGSALPPSGNKDYVRVYNAGNNGGQARVMTHHVTKRNKQIR
jgi:hypothetical protein